MTAEEAIEFIEKAALRNPNIDLHLFREKVHHDLWLFRRKEDLLLSIESLSKSVDPDLKVPKPAFAIPEKYSEVPELWIVFSSFYMFFVDIIAIAVDIVATLSKLNEKEQVARLIFADEDTDEQDDEVLEVVDLNALQDAHETILVLASNIGQILFGSTFSINDFEEELGGENE